MTRYEKCKFKSEAVEMIEYSAEKNKQNLIFIKAHTDAKHRRVYVKVFNKAKECQGYYMHFLFEIENIYLKCLLLRDIQCTDD